MSTANVRQITAEETRPLRHAVLRPHQSPDELVYPGDDAPDTLHLGVDLDGAIVGVASVYHQPPPDEDDDERAWRLRGMAVTLALQRQGHGRALLKACLAHVAAQGGRMMWCNARTTAAEFYRALGFEIAGEAYELEGIGPHYMMWRTVGERATTGSS